MYVVCGYVAPHSVGVYTGAGADGTVQYISCSYNAVEASLCCIELIRNHVTENAFKQ